jgi:hypothetical protein
MTRHVYTAVFLALAATGAAPAADLTKVERRITKEPAYATKSPRYALLVIGPKARDRVWLVKDGDTLYVDRNGNGDLTDPDEKISPRKGGSAEDGYSFDIPDLTLGGRKHLNLRADFRPLRQLALGENARRGDVQAAVKKDPQGEVLSLSLQATMPHLNPVARVLFLAGPLDLDGPLCPSASPNEAPVVHLGGPLEISCHINRPTLRRNRANELMLAVGTRGLGAGTFAAVGYQNTIPADAHPVGKLAFAPGMAGGESVKKRFEFKERC